MSRGHHTEEEKLKIRESRKATSLRRRSQVVKCYEMKIVEKRLNKRQHEELDKLFIEGKRLYNFILSEKKKNEVTLNCIVPTDYKEVICLDKDKKEVVYPLEYGLVFQDCKQSLDNGCKRKDIGKRNELDSRKLRICKRQFVEETKRVLFEDNNIHKQRGYRRNRNKRKGNRS